MKVDLSPKIDPRKQMLAIHAYLFVFEDLFDEIIAVSSRDLSIGNVDDFLERG